MDPALHKVAFSPEIICLNDDGSSSGEARGVLPQGRVVVETLDTEWEAVNAWCVTRTFRRSFDIGIID